MRASPKIAIGLAALLVAAGIAAGRIGALQGGGLPVQRGAREAPELKGIATWLNGGPLTIRGLRGRVVLLDFWTYSCINCVRTFDHLRALHERYAPAGLQIVGVHSPEFEFEKQPDRVRAAIDRHGIPYPVALDNDMATWRAYRNNYWPHVYLVDASGRIRYDHIGEGGEAEIEDRVRDLLAQNGAALPSALDEQVREAPSRDVTPEIYAGFERGALGNPAGYRPTEVADYGPPGQDEARDTLYLGGRWRAEREYVEAADTGATVRLGFRARSVFIVAAPGSAGGVVRVLLDGSPVPVKAYRGQPAGEQVRITHADLYRVVVLDGVESHRLTLTFEPGVRLYSLTFG